MTIKRKGASPQQIEAALQRARSEIVSSLTDGLARLREESRLELLEREEKYLKKVLETCEWNLNETAREIGCPVSSLQRALARHPAIEKERQAMARQLGWLRRKSAA